jgi:hypothetical protein
MKQTKDIPAALKYFMIIALPIGIYLALMGVNQNFNVAMEEKENLIHTVQITQPAEDAIPIVLAEGDHAELTVYADQMYFATLETAEVDADLEAEQFGAGEVSTEEAEELRRREMMQREKVALSSRMAPAPEPKVTEKLAPEAVPEAAPEAAPEKKEAPAPAVNNADLNQYVLDAIKAYQIGKVSYPYLLNNDYANYNGVTSTLSYKGKVLLRAHPSGSRASHCVGITFEVFFKAMQERNRQLGISADDFNGMTWDNLFDLALYWFVASGSKSTNNIVLGVEKYGIGKGIHRLEDVRPGDFIDFNRVNGTGHTVVFMNWIKDGGSIIGFRYWSSQGSTGGISYNEEYFSLPGKKGNVIINPIYIVRILPVSQYRRF